MKSEIKKLLSRLWYRPNSRHRILFGPMQGMWFKCSDNTGLAAVYSGNEKANQRIYAQVVRAGDTVIDAGANWGVHTLYLAKLVGGSGHVHAFEPHPIVVDELRWHVSQNSMNQVTIHPCALFDREDSLHFELGANSKTSHLVNSSERSDNHQVMVPAKPLDSIVEAIELSSLRLMKIDVEGAEAALLQGATKTIANHRPHLIVELHSPEQDLLVAQKLSDWGYVIQRVDGPEILHLDRPWPDPNGVWGTLHAIPT